MSRNVPDKAEREDVQKSCGGDDGWGAGRVRGYGACMKN